MTTLTADGRAEIGTARARVSVEALCIMALFGFVLVTRLAALGAVTMTPAEIPPALAAWRAFMPALASGEVFVTDSAMLFWAQGTAMMLWGGSEWAARLFTALAGVALVLTPLLFRDLLGRDRAFILALILAFSPVTLAASRFSSPVIWSALFAVLMLWGVWRFWADERPRYAVLATIMGGALILLSEPGGLMLALILLGSAAVALTFAALDAPLDADVTGEDFLAEVRARFASWPVGFSLLATLLIVFCTATGFMLYSGGLALVGETLRGFVSGWGGRVPGSPVFYPLVTAFFYETFLFVLAGVSVIVLSMTRRITFTERLLMAWAALAIIAALIYPGAGAAHALWLILPLAGLTSWLVSAALGHDGRRDDLWPLDSATDGGRGKWLLAVIAFTLLMMVALHFQVAVRGFWQTDGGVADFLSRINMPAFNLHAVSMVGFLVSLLFIVIGYFLASSLVGAIIPAQALVIGALAFALLTSFGSGWNLVGTRANDPAEVWFVDGTSSQVDLMRQTLIELAIRQTEGMPTLPVAAVTPDDGAVAWALRDFHNTQFVASLDDARTAQVIVMPAYDLVRGLTTPHRPDIELGAAYVGQDFATQMTWRSSWLNGWQWLAWWSARLDTGRIPAVARQRMLNGVVLWVRQDIYDGNRFDINNR
ncbi:MAG: hypothetical protein EA396_15020 [Anaerolineaceae bacterium]|nr:MAG: hypothetical protein EA396_15020 [Anaerolineaceae bacterium]